MAFFPLWTVFAALRTVQLVPFFKHVADRWRFALISKQSEKFVDEFLTRGSTPILTSRNPKVFCLLDWNEVLKHFFFFFLQNPKKSISQGMFYCTHQEHRAVLKNIGPQYTQMQSFILTPWMYLWKSRRFLVFKWIICCISDGYTEFSLILWLGCWKFLYAANTIGRYHHVFQSGFFQNALSINHTQSLGPKLSHPCLQKHTAATLTKIFVQFCI